MRTAVVLLNLGGPLAEADVEPFLFNFFMDANIIAAPKPLRWLIAKYVAKTRARGAAHEAYKKLNFKSPLLENTKAQAAALEARLGGDFRVFVSMRYWHPLADEVAREVKAYAPDKAVLLPLYPQFSTATVKSSLADWARAAQGAGLDVPTRSVCCWPENEGFVSASAALIKTALEAAPPDTRLLFSAHGLPEKTIRAGDPYRRHCERTAAAILEKLPPGTESLLCYQSRVGPLKWIGPSTGEALELAARDGKGVAVYPLAFVSEHVETLVEIEIDYRARAGALGLPYFARVPAVGTHPLFIGGLAGLALEEGARICENRSACRASSSPTTNGSRRSTSSR